MSFRLQQLDAPARVLMSLLFLISGYGKLTASSATQAYMEAYHVPGILVWPAAVWELGAGLLLVVGLWVRPLAILLASWCVLTALIFHTDFADQNQMINFLKNLTMAGGFILIARNGAFGLSVDGLLAAHKDAPAARAAAGRA